MAAGDEPPRPFRRAHSGVRRRDVLERAAAEGHPGLGIPRAAGHDRPCDGERSHGRRRQRERRMRKADDLAGDGRHGGTIVRKSYLPIPNILLCNLLHFPD